MKRLKKVQVQVGHIKDLEKNLQFENQSVPKPAIGIEDRHWDRNR